jgi:hypothetical protein
MPEPSPGYLLSLCTAAADLDYGLLIESDNMEALRYDLYAKLRAAGMTTEDLGIMLCVPSTPNTLYILKRSVELPE